MKILGLKRPNREMGPSAGVANKNTGFTSLTCSQIQLYDNAEYCCSIFSSLGFSKLIKMTGMNLKELANVFLVSFFVYSALIVQIPLFQLFL